MGFSQSRDGSGVTVVKVEGQLIVGNRQELKELVFAALDKGDRRILIDFSQTGYIDSSGLGALVSISKRVREAGGELAQPGAPVLSVLDPRDKYVQLYVPVADVGHFTLGRTVAIELEYSPDPKRIVEWVEEAYTQTDRLMKLVGLRG